MEERQVEKLILAISNLNDKVERLNNNTEKTTANLSEYDKTYLENLSKQINQAHNEIKQEKNIKMDIQLDDSLKQQIQSQITNDLIPIKDSLNQDLKSIKYLVDTTEIRLEEFEEKISHSNKFFYPTLYGVFIAIIGFLMLFFLQSIVGNLFGESYYPMIAEKVETSTGFNTLLWYLAYITPVFSVIFALYLVIRLLLKPKLKDFMFK